MQGKQQNLISMKFGRLTVLEKTKNEKRNGNFWVCICDCGNKTNPIATNSLLKLKTRSCGCYKIKKIKEANTSHGMTKTKTYNSWQSMWARCTDKKRRDFNFYKDKTPFESWKLFENFLSDMGERPENTSLDRIDNLKGYFKENCRWATIGQQARNKSTNINLIINGNKYCLKDACNLFNTSYQNAKSRIFNGLNIYEAALTPKTNKHKRNKGFLNKEGVFIKE